MNELTQALTKKLVPKSTLKDFKEMVQAQYNVLHVRGFKEVFSEKDLGKYEVLEWMHEMLDGAQ